MNIVPRRLVLAGAIAAAGRAHAETVLRVGDQRGNQRAVMEAADVLRDVPYKIVWHEFPAAAPLIEAIWIDEAMFARYGPPPPPPRENGDSEVGDETRLTVALICAAHF